MASVTLNNLRDSLEHAQVQCDLFDGWKTLAKWIPIIGWIFLSLFAALPAYFEKRDALNALAQRVNDQPIDANNEAITKVVIQAKKFLLHQKFSLFKSEAVLKSELIAMLMPDLVPHFGELLLSDEFLNKGLFPCLKAILKGEKFEFAEASEVIKEIFDSLDDTVIKDKLEKFAEFYFLEDAELLAIIESDVVLDAQFVEKEYQKSLLTIALFPVFGNLLFDPQFASRSIPVILELSSIKLNDPKFEIDKDILDIMKPNFRISKSALDIVRKNFDLIDKAKEVLLNFKNLHNLSCGELDELLGSRFNFTILSGDSPGEYLHNAFSMYREVVGPYLKQNPQYGFNTMFNLLAETSYPTIADESLVLFTIYIDLFSDKFLKLMRDVYDKNSNEFFEKFTALTEKYHDQIENAKPARKAEVYTVLSVNSSESSSGSRSPLATLREVEEEVVSLQDSQGISEEMFLKIIGDVFASANLANPNLELQVTLQLALEMQPSDSQILDLVFNGSVGYSVESLRTLISHLSNLKKEFNLSDKALIDFVKEHFPQCFSPDADMAIAPFLVRYTMVKEFWTSEVLSGLNDDEKLRVFQYNEILSSNDDFGDNLSVIKSLVKNPEFEDRFNGWQEELQKSRASNAFVKVLSNEEFLRKCQEDLLAVRNLSQS